MNTKISIRTQRQGLFDITQNVAEVVTESGIKNGVCCLLIQHTSASLIIQENADPSARYDLETWLNRLVPEDDPHFTHVFEGEDDMPSHIKAAITSPSLSIPVMGGRLALGTWQGIYLWEHRKSAHTRSIAVYVG